MSARALTAALVLALTAATPALASSPDPEPYGSGQFGSFHHIIPAGQQGDANAVQAGLFLSTKQYPPHFADQRDPYTNLLYATPGMTDARIPQYFPDANFGVAPGHEESRESPRDDVTIVRDDLGRPHVYGSTRPGLMYGAGWAAAEDHLWMMDVLRHAGEGTLSSFAGGANAGMDEGTWLAAPYTATDRAQMVANLNRLPGGGQVVDDVTNWVAGVNAYIAKTRTNPTLLPVEYPAAGHPTGPEDWTPTDVLDVATLIGSQLGNGGGNELQQAQLLLGDMARFGRKRGYRIWRDLREPDDPEAPVTATRRSGFPYDVAPRTLGRTVALPDRGTLKFVSAVAESTGAGTKPGAQLSTQPAVDRALFRFPSTDSNALLVSARHSRSGHPLAVMGSQAGYFSAEIWRYEDLHGPGIAVAGSNIPGTGPYVEIGHGPDYAWSATSASQDIIDVFAVPTCRDRLHYLFRGHCLAMEPVEQHIAWTPNAADSTAAGSETLRVYRTRLGIVIARAKVHGRAVVYTQLRSTYRHELDSALAFADWNTPAKIKSAREFQHAAAKVGYTFNWFYVDNRHIAYINTGANPVRARGVNGLLPVAAGRATEWRGWNPLSNSARYQPFAQRPQAIDQDYLVSWNNKEAHHCCGNGPYTPVWRSQSLTDAINREFRVHGGKITLGNLVDAAEFGATVDLRGYKLIPWALRMLGKQRDPQLAAAARRLAVWARKGAPRIDRNRDGHYDDATAVQLADAWMQTMPRAVFAPVLGRAAFTRYDDELRPDVPNTFHSQLHAHLGSSWEDGWFGFLQKDIRTVLDPRRVRGRWSLRFCGRGNRARCRAALSSSLRAALKFPASKLYDDPTVQGKCGNMDQQACYDAIEFRAVTAVTQPLIPWQNRPTQQQTVEIRGHR